MSGVRRGRIVVFCGLPGTLKSFLAARVAEKLGFCYLPTAAVGALSSEDAFGGGEGLASRRRERYNRVAEVVAQLAAGGADVVVDGGFPLLDDKLLLAEAAPVEALLFVHCRADDPDVRRSRLVHRSSDSLHHEASSATAILDDGSALHPHDWLEDRRFPAPVVEVDTLTGEIHRRPGGDPILYNVIERLLARELVDYRLLSGEAMGAAVRDHFDELASAFDSLTPWTTEPRLLEALTSGTLPSERVLDLCCGTGIVGAEFSGAGARVVGCDIAIQMLRLARYRLTCVVAADALRLPFAERSFAKVVMRQALHYLPPAQALGEVWRVLKPDGAFGLAAAVVPSGNLLDLWATFKSFTQPLRRHVFTAEQAIAWLQGSGFQIERVVELRAQRKETLESVAARGREPREGWSPFFARLAEEIGRVEPSMKFEFDGEHISYQQYFVCIWSERIDGTL